MRIIGSLVLVCSVVAGVNAGQAQSQKPETTSGEGFVGYVEAANPLERISFRALSEDGSTSLPPIDLAVAPDGSFASTEPMPHKFVVKTFPPCVPILKLVAADRTVIAAGAPVDTAGVKRVTEAVQGQPTRTTTTVNAGISGGFTTVVPGGIVTFKIEIGGVDLSGCSESPAREPEGKEVPK